ncbi:MAG: hypothetical protein JO311_05580 [Candidatus Eremiobacteraeota bacterium]|nr:hypothetical protein [Candidatus Eremiobacteraeota bacterium]MBV9263480.1 hypothetical protein [Candidatus Eremiobacteraeota bacterium]
MNYVEWLRVRNLLRIVAIILGILLVLAVVLRISVARYTSPTHWVSQIENQPDVKVQHVTLPDGTKRTIVDHPAKRTHVVVDDHGYAGIHIVVTEPTGAHHESDHFSVGSVSVSESKHGTVTTTVIDTNGAVPMIYYMALADLVALIVATMLAAPFAREADGHLEVALTKPIPRARFAVEAIAADVAGIVAASLLTIVALYICQLLFESPRLDFSGVNGRAIAMGIACPLAWYGLVCAATTWMHRAFGAVLGFAWPIAILIGVLAAIHPNNVVGLFIHDVAWALSRLNPISYVTFPREPTSTALLASDPTFVPRISVMILMFVVYSGVAIVKWQRLEA